MEMTNPHLRSPWDISSMEAIEEYRLRCLLGSANPRDNAPRNERHTEDGCAVIHRRRRAIRLGQHLRDH
jgi:hypothetical protein